ncbi:MAG: thioredoxin family protein [Pirellulales bacterium]|nr:thioredoxin family protein [Pirellulales bacterium]
MSNDTINNLHNYKMHPSRRSGVSSNQSHWPQPLDFIPSSHTEYERTHMNESSSQPAATGSAEPLPDRRNRFHFWRCFWLTFLVVSLVYAWYSFYVPPNSIAWADNYTSALQQAADSGKPMILYFTGTWCVPCRVMKRRVWADEEVKGLVNTQFIPVAIDFDNPDDTEVLARYNVGGPPVTIITDSQGNALRWRAGGISKTEFLELLKDPNPTAAKDM